jgi:DNA-binding MarR family transcriptional regulator
VAGLTQSGEHAALTTFNRQIRELSEIQRSFLHNLPITEHSYFALQTLQSAPDGAPMKVGELATLLALSSSAPTELVNRLCARGWTDRVEVEGDRRQVGIQITPEGQSFLLSLMRAQQASLERHQRRIASLLTSLQGLLPELSRR